MAAWPLASSERTSDNIASADAVAGAAGETTGALDPLEPLVRAVEAVAAEAARPAGKTSGSQDDEELSSEAWRARGGDRFRVGLFAEARDCYGEAIDSEMASDYAGGKSFASALYANRSVCFLKLGDPDAALLDAGRAVQMDRKNRKAYFRKGEAFLALGRLNDALDAYQHAQRLLEEAGEPSDAALDRRLVECDLRLPPPERGGGGG